MKVNEPEKGVIENYLRDALAAGDRWVAFSEPPGGLTVYTMHSFRTAAEADELCVTSNNTIYLGGDGYQSSDYRYMPIANMQQALAQDTPATRLSAEDAAKQMQVLGVQLVAGHDLEQAAPLISSQNYFPVEWTKHVQPSEEIDQYHIIRHTHPGHMIYEKGHGLQTLKTFDNYKDAAAWLQDQLKDKLPQEKIDDYLLIGQYRNCELKQDMEGWPESHCGLTLARASSEYIPGAKTSSYKLDEINSINEQAIVRHYLYARAGADGQLKLYDDRLQETLPQELKTSAYPTQFTYETINTQNLKIMLNEKSYDYLKNQLLYLGFGEEIAAPLKEKMEQGLTEFSLPHNRKFGQDETNSTLHFAKGTESDLIFFNRYELTLKQPGKEDLTQTYFVGQHYNYTLQERYNMLDNRFVYREQPKMAPVEENGETKMKPTGETYLGWRGVNFKETDKHGNFLLKPMFWNHERELSKYPIKQNDEPYDRLRLLAALQKGNKVSVTLVKDGEESKALIVANPRLQRFDFYDTNGQKLEVKQKERQKLAVAEKPVEGQQQGQAQAPQQQQSQMEEQKQAVAEAENQAAGQRKRNGMRVA